MNRPSENESPAVVEARPPSSASIDAEGLATSVLSADAWQRRFGVPWERVERAVRAVSERAAAASRRRFADLGAAVPASEARPG